jgi:hypothetical protein
MAGNALAEQEQDGRRRADQAGARRPATRWARSTAAGDVLAGDEVHEKEAPRPVNTLGKKQARRQVMRWASRSMVAGD